MTTLKRLMLAASVLTIFAGTYGCGLFSDSWEAPKFVKTEGEDLADLMPSWLTWHVAGEKGDPTGFLAREGDLLIGGKDFYLRYRASDGPSLKVAANDWSVKFGDTVVAVRLDQDGQAWLNAADARQLAGVRTLAIEEDLTAAALTSLKKLASANAGLELLMFMGSNDSLAEVLSSFHPRVLLVEKPMTEPLVKALANQSQIETLLIDGSEAQAFDALKKLPKLRTLVLGEWNVANAGPFPSGLSSLKTLIVVEPTGLTDLKALGAAAPGLETLTLSMPKEPIAVTGIEQMSGLQTLILNSNKLETLPAMAELKALRWVGLPAETSQEQFAAFVSAHPKLEILELAGNKSVKDLAPLASLKNLWGVIVDGPVDSLATLQKLTTLRFVGVSKTLWESNPAEVEAIRKALPDAIVVKVEPFCLGSGWILLVVAAPIVALWVRRRRSTSVPSAA